MVLRRASACLALDSIYEPKAKAKCLESHLQLSVHLKKRKHGINESFTNSNKKRVSIKYNIKAFYVTYLITSSLFDTSD